MKTINHESSFQATNNSDYRTYHGAWLHGISGLKDLVLLTLLFCTNEMSLGKIGPMRLCCWVNARCISFCLEISLIIQHTNYTPTVHIYSRTTLQKKWFVTPEKEKSFKLIDIFSKTDLNQIMRTLLRNRDIQVLRNCFGTMKEQNKRNIICSVL